MKVKIIFLCTLSVSLIGQNLSEIQLYAAALQSDGKLVCCGAFVKSENQAILLLRYTSEGFLDPSFGINGVVNTFLNNSSIANALVIQPDGKIVIAGSTQSTTTEFLIIRYLSDGSLDPNFGTSGITTTTIANGASANAIGLQSDNKIIVVGTSSSSGQNQLSIVRYTTSGLLDVNYATGGIATTKIGSNAQATSLAIQADDKVIIGGTTTSIVNQFTLARYTTTGILDNSFGSNGIVITPIGINSLIQAITLQATGEIIAAGSSDGDFAIARYTTTGILDGSFGTGGIAITNSNGSDQINGIIIQPNGEIVVAGFFADDIAIGFLLARYTSTGTLDPSFGVSGIVSDMTNSPSQARTVLLQSDGKIIPVGFSECGALLFRYIANGTLDPTFGRNGKVFRPLNNFGCLGLLTTTGTGELIFNACNFVNNSGHNPNTIFFTYSPTTGPARPPLATWALNNSTNIQDPLSLTFQIPKNFDNTSSAEIDVHLLINDNNAMGSLVAIQLKTDFKSNAQELGSTGFTQTIISNDISLSEPSVGNLRHVFTTISLDASTITPQDWAFLVLDRTSPTIPVNEYKADVFLSSISFRYNQTSTT